MLLWFITALHRPQASGGKWRAHATGWNRRNQWVTYAVRRISSGYNLSIFNFLSHFFMLLISNQVWDEYYGFQLLVLRKHLPYHSSPSTLFCENNSDHDDYVHSMLCMVLTGGYKGYGLAMMVEVFCGILSGASFGPNVRRWKTNDRPANLVCLHT